MWAYYEKTGISQKVCPKEMALESQNLTKIKKLVFLNNRDMIPQLSGMIRLPILFFLMTESPLLVAAKEHALLLLQSVAHYPYHNIEHTLDVFERAKHLGKKENITVQEMEDLLIAAIFHDTGFVRQYPKNEPIGAQIAREFLELKWVDNDRINHIQDIILTTILFSTPKDICGKIIQDADLDNLGRDDCFERTAAYRRELKVYTDFHEAPFRTFTKKLLETFQFNTPTQTQERWAKKAENFDRFDEYYPDDSTLAV